MEHYYAINHSDPISPTAYPCIRKRSFKHNIEKGIRKFCTKSINLFSKGTLKLYENLLRPKSPKKRGKPPTFK